MHHPSAMPGPTQRRITLLRHARARVDEGDDDHARPLAPDGRAAAEALAGWLAGNALLPELVLCSSAARTRETLAALPANLPVILTPRAYLAGAGELLALLQETDDAVRHVLLVGHNPGIHGLLASLAGDYVHEADAEAVSHGYPTCGLASMTVRAPRWAGLTPGAAVVDYLRFSAED